MRSWTRHTRAAPCTLCRNGTYIWSSHPSSRPALQVGGLTALASLSLKSCSLSAYPVGLKSCSALTNLDLSYNPGLKLGPRPSLAGLARLQHLTLKHCGLAQLPTGITQLRALACMELAGNQIKASKAEARWLAAHFQMPPEGASQWVQEVWIYRRRTAAGGAAT